MATKHKKSSKNKAVEAAGVQGKASPTAKIKNEPVTKKRIEDLEEIDDDDIEEEPQEPPKPSPLAAKKSAEAAEITRWFAACGRCSFFLSAYQIIDGVTDLSTAVANSPAKWLVLDWNREVGMLVKKSYGSRIDSGCFHLDGTCVECRRLFVFHAKDDDNPGTFQIQTRAR